MQYILSDLLRLPLKSRLEIIECLVLRSDSESDTRCSIAELKKLTDSLQRNIVGSIISNHELNTNKKS
jgi:hypothetical protein